MFPEVPLVVLQSHPALLQENVKPWSFVTTDQRGMGAKALSRPLKM
jgi:hypothetical protein